MKIFLKLILLLGLVVYLVFAFVKFNKSEGEVQCTALSVSVTDSDKADFVSAGDIRQILEDTKLNPVGKSMKDIRLSKIKKAVDCHQFVMASLCYATPKGEVVIEVSQKLPLLRVVANVGEGYYVDARGNKIPHVNYPADVPVVTGNVDYVRHKPFLAKFGQIVQANEFWHDMIEQINFTPEGNVELTPRIGDHIVALGKPQDLETKLAHLKIFYEKVLKEVGWNKYSRISLEYNNQVVCTKKEKENKKI